ncbi:MAG: iron-sulfur cluster assembly scaffold protein [Saprospiraceae bacterium]|nr:iron-sulfur cluster assembly scaffold protein [Saprospiraceae bacterium]
MDLYHPRILELSKEPVNFRKNEEAEFKAHAYNPLCGDEFTIYLDDGRTVGLKVSFHGYGCAVSKASAALLTQSLEGEDLKGALQKIEHFMECFESKADTGNADLNLLLAARDFPSRRSCALQAWQECQKTLSAIKKTG